MKKLTRTTVALSLTLFAFFLMLTSCQEKVTDLQAKEEIPVFSLEKDMVIFAEDGESSITVRVFAHDQATLDQYTEANFEVTAIHEGESIDEVLAAKFSTEPTAEEAAFKIDPDEASQAPEFAYQEIGRTLADGVSELALTIKAAPAGNGKFFGLLGPHIIFSPIGETHGMINRAEIHRVSANFAVKFGLKARDTWNDPYYTVVGDFQTLSSPNSSYVKNFSPSISRCYFRVKRGLGRHTTAFYRD